MNRDELLDTIKRLLALSSSSNENESASALARANKLMMEHNISMFDVNNETSTSNYDEIDVYTAGRASSKDPYLCSILQDYFFVKAIYIPSDGYQRKTTLKFFGDKVNIQIAVYVYKVLDILFSVYADVNKIQVKHRRAYYQGLCHGFKRKLKEERDAMNRNIASSGTALVLIDKALVKAYNNRFPTTKTKSVSKMTMNDRAYNQGIVDAKEINLRQGIEGTKGTTQPKIQDWS